jgi:hypothetical protein
MASRADKLRALLDQARKTSDQTQKAFLKAEDRLHSIADREARREQVRRPG